MNARKWLTVPVLLCCFVGCSHVERDAVPFVHVSPVAGAVAKVLEPVQFLALTTPVLVFAGLGLGKDAPLLRRIGWRIVPVGLVSFAASFVGSAAIAQFALHVG